VPAKGVGIIDGGCLQEGAFQKLKVYTDALHMSENEGPIWTLVGATLPCKKHPPTLFGTHYTSRLLERNALPGKVKVKVRLVT
jgi:hypothetical protein